MDGHVDVLVSVVSVTDPAVSWEEVASFEELSMLDQSLVMSIRDFLD